MALFVIADLHLSLGADKPMDVFPGWNDYVGRLAENWRAVVGQEDTVVVAGDISWAMKLEEARQDLAFLDSLPGTKLLLKGNHDFWWSTRRKIETFFSENHFASLRLIFNSAERVGEIAVCGTRGWLYNASSEEDKKIVARENGRLAASLDSAKQCGGTPVVFLHYPPVYDDAAAEPFLNTMASYGVRDCYFGHIHGGPAARKVPAGEYRGIRMHLVSADHVKFIPQLVRNDT